MSAPSVIDLFTARPYRPDHSAAADPLPLTGEERRSRHPVALLSREHDALCRSAVDPLEIAAGLEAVGISDTRARRGYGSATLFDLAEEIYARVPRRPQTDAPAPDPWDRPRQELAARGLVYALPGLLLAGSVQYLSVTEALLLLAVSVVGAGVNQALSYLGHLLCARREPDGLLTLLRSAMVGVVVGGVLVAGVALLSGAVSPRAAGLVLLAATYLVSATALMLLDRHRWLLMLLGPGAAVSLLALVSSLPASRSLALLLGGVSVACAFVAAWRVTAPQTGRRREAIPLSRGDLRGSIPHTLHGIASIALLALVPISALQHGGGVPDAVGPVMLPVVLSLCSAEIQLYAFRRNARRLLTGSDTWEFGRSVRRELMRRTAAYAAPLTVLSLVVALFQPASVGAHDTGHTQLLTYYCLGLALFLASLLISTGHTAAVAALELLALAAALCLPLLLGLPAGGVGLAVTALLAAAVSGSGVVLLGRAVSHR